MECKAWIMGQAAGAIDDIKTAKEIVDDMVVEAAALLRGASELLVVDEAVGAKL